MSTRVNAGALYTCLTMQNYDPAGKSGVYGRRPLLVHVADRERREQATCAYSAENKVFGGSAAF